MHRQLSQREIWAIQFNERHARADLFESASELHNLIDTLIYLNQVLTEQGVPIAHWQKSAETLLMKFAFHGLSVHSLLSGITMRSQYYPKELNGLPIFDTPSAKAVLRSMLEAFLMFHHIYVNPVDDDEKELRYNAWIYSSLLDRQNFPVETQFAKEQSARDTVAIKNFREAIVKLPAFVRLTEKQQNALINKGSGKLFLHWATIMENTGFGPQHSISQLYTYLSMYAHSEGMIVIQMEDPNWIKNVRHQALLDLYYSKLLVTLMIRTLARWFPPVQERYRMLSEKLQFDIGFFLDVVDADSNHYTKG